MMKTMMVLAGCGLLIAATTARGSLAVGSEIKEWPTNAAKHVIAIVRDAADDAGKKMIETAEAAAPGTNAWWSGVKNNIKQPFALTKEALAYYEGLIKGYQNKSWKTYNEPRSKFDYKAAVTHHDSFDMNGTTYKDVDVVTMTLSFSAEFTEDGTAGVHFNKTRTVVLDAKGAVQAIDGDGETDVPMWMI